MEIGVRELKEHASNILRRVREDGETVIITYRGKAVARISPMEDLEAKKARVEEVLRKMEELSKEISKDWPKGLSAVDAVREQRREL